MEKVWVFEDTQDLSQWIQLMKKEMLTKHYEEFSVNRSCLTAEWMPAPLHYGLCFTGNVYAEVGQPSLKDVLVIGWG